MNQMDVAHLRDDLARYIAGVQEINNRLLGRETLI